MAQPKKTEREAEKAKRQKSKSKVIMKDISKELIEAIIKGLKECEAAGDLVIATSTPATASKRISERVRETFTGDIFSPEEVLAISSLIYHATTDKRFYDCEISTLTGYSAEKMQDLGTKLRKLTSL